jgi:hypothetical protein
MSLSTAGRTAAVMSLAALGVAVWPRLASRLDCFWSALYIAPFWWLIGASMVESAALRRRAFIHVYLSPGAILARLLHPGVLLVAVQGVKSGVLVLFLLVSALGLSVAQVGLLLGDVLVLLLLQSLLGRLAGQQVRADIREPLLRHWAHWLNALFLWLALPAAALLSGGGRFAGMDWDQALLTSARQVQAGCDSLALLARLQAATQALPGWLADNLSAGPGVAGQAVLWSLLLLSAGVSFLFAWAYSRLLSGAAIDSLTTLRRGRGSS